MREIYSHTSLRGIAALLVVLHHYKRTLASGFDVDEITLFFEGARSLVDFFFILSGFVIAYVYFEKARPDTAFWTGYLKSRVARIYPLHLLTLLIMLALVLRRDDVDWQKIGPEVLRTVSLTHAWGWQDAFSLNFPSWSISGEFAAYLLFPVFVWALRRGTTLSISLMTLCAFGLVGLHDVATEMNGWRWERLGLLRAIPLFFIGVVLFQLRDVFAKISSEALTWVQVVTVCGLVYLLHLNAFLTALVPFFVVLVLSTYEDRGGVARMLSVKPLHVLGVLSYSIYLLHIPVRLVGYSVWAKLFGPLKATTELAMFVGGCTLVTVLAGWCIHRWFEMPMRDYIKKI